MRDPPRVWLGPIIVTPGGQELRLDDFFPAGRKERLCAALVLLVLLVLVVIAHGETVVARERGVRTVGRLPSSLGLLLLGSNLGQRLDRNLDKPRTSVEVRKGPNAHCRPFSYAEPPS